MNRRKIISTNNQWEKRFGYARVNQCENTIFIGGTVAIDPDGSPHAPGDAGAQTKRCYEIIENALVQLKLDRSIIMRSRIFVTDIAHADAVGNAHKSFFQSHNPCLTQVEVRSLIAPEFVVEIECDGYVLDSIKD